MSGCSRSRRKAYTSRNKKGGGEGKNVKIMLQQLAKMTVIMIIIVLSLRCVNYAVVGANALNQKLQAFST